MKLCQKRHGRHGYLMLDTLIVMTLTILVLSTTSIWIYKTMQYSSDVKQRISHTRNISRIGKLLRTDARDADSISFEEDAIEIATGEEKVRYTIESNRIFRKATTGEQTHQDEFTFASNAALAWEQGSFENVAMLNIGRDFSDLTPGKSKHDSGLDSQIRISLRPRASQPEVSQ